MDECWMEAQYEFVVFGYSLACKEFRVNRRLLRPSRPRQSLIIADLVRKLWTNLLKRPL